MKVIDLLNKIANKEEVPKKIKVLFNVFEYDEDNYSYKNVDKTQDSLLRHLGYYKGIALNEEVEIIEDTPKEEIQVLSRWYPPKEDKKIEKLNIKFFNSNYIELVDKINKIIDRLNGE